jgi:CheY-like chemotaxis protein
MSRILVAEDDPHILRVISMWLRRQGHEVLEARNGLAARQLMQRDPVDILVSDINMPGLDGLALIESVVGHGPVRRGIIVLTNRWDHGDIRDRLADWGVHVLPKPFSPTRLSELVAALTRVETSSEPGTMRSRDQGRTAPPQPREPASPRCLDTSSPCARDPSPEVPP